jgi:hypothetical protein
MEIQEPFQVFGSSGEPRPGPLAFESGISILVMPTVKLEDRVKQIFLNVLFCFPFLVDFLFVIRSSPDRLELLHLYLNEMIGV